MNSSSRFVVRSVAWIGVAMLIIVLFHIGGSTIALRVGQFSPLTGAFIGGFLTLTCVILPMGRREATEPWLRNEQLGWILIGCGVIMWGLGESFWRYYVSIGESPFPSLADIGYFSFPLLVFTGLLLQPPSGDGRKRLLLLLDSLICMGSILAIAWYLLLGSLAQAPGEANIAKFLGLYYPISDTALLSCVLFLLLRGQGRAYQATARRVSLLVIGLGLCFFVFSDFLFNVQLTNNSVHMCDSVKGCATRCSSPGYPPGRKEPRRTARSHSPITAPSPSSPATRSCPSTPRRTRHSAYGMRSDTRTADGKRTSSRSRENDRKSSRQATPPRRRCSTTSGPQGSGSSAIRSKRPFLRQRETGPPSPGSYAGSNRPTWRLSPPTHHASAWSPERSRKATPAHEPASEPRRAAAATSVRRKGLCQAKSAAGPPRPVSTTPATRSSSGSTSPTPAYSHPYTGHGKATQTAAPAATWLPPESRQRLLSHSSSIARVRGMSSEPAQTTVKKGRSGSDRPYAGGRRPIGWAWTVLEREVTDVRFGKTGLAGMLHVLVGSWVVCAGLVLAAPASAAESVYWANGSDNTISFANLNGSGGGNLNTAGANVERPAGVAVDPAAGRVYWANHDGEPISSPTSTAAAAAT